MINDELILIITISENTAYEIQKQVKTYLFELAETTIKVEDNRSAMVYANKVRLHCCVKM